MPFHDDLTPADEDFLNLGDFQHYKEAPDVAEHRRKLGIYDETSEDIEPAKTRKNHPEKQVGDVVSQISQSEASKLPKNTPLFADLCTASRPVVFISQLSDPYLNLAIEDYVYSQMPVPKIGANPRLMFYVNLPCVVVGKNQNPWREVNLPLLTALRLPLVRRRLGGGTVVHDLGNVNYSFMTRKEDFDRFTFANLVVRAVNSLVLAEKNQISVNERGDIITQKEARKVSGSAYKLSRGKSYHHGTMLLNLKLDVLRQLLHRDENALGHVHLPSAVASVSSPVANLHIDLAEFIDAVLREFQNVYGTSIVPETKDESTDFDQTELLGLQGFVDAYSSRECKVFTIDESTLLPEEIQAIRAELMQWEWKYGATPRFQHKFHHPRHNVHVTIDVERKGLVSAVDVEGGDVNVKEAFQYLKEVVARGDEIQYTGSNVAGFVVDDELSEWIGNAIDGTS